MVIQAQPLQARADCTLHLENKSLFNPVEVFSGLSSLSSFTMSDDDDFMQDSDQEQ